jgi:hypothetical protein
MYILYILKYRGTYVVTIKYGFLNGEWDVVLLIARIKVLCTNICM